MCGPFYPPFIAETEDSATGAVIPEIVASMVIDWSIAAAVDIANYMDKMYNLSLSLSPPPSFFLFFFLFFFLSLSSPVGWTPGRS